MLSSKSPFYQLRGFAARTVMRMLWHVTGYKFADDGQDTRAFHHYLGHKSIMHTVRYTATRNRTRLLFKVDPCPMYDREDRDYRPVFVDSATDAG